ncbi:type II toxin-antitoxin system VapC family toxin, partial [Bathymodiolus thermophilus thioautotrophic gill symbiont]
MRIRNNYIADTNILIFHFDDKLADEMPPLLGISIISEIELFAYPDLNEDGKQKLKSALVDIYSFPLSENIKEQAIQLRQTHKLKIPDAIICATALVNNATLLTNDKQLLKLPRLR